MCHSLCEEQERQLAEAFASVPKAVLTPPEPDTYTITLQSHPAVFESHCLVRGWMGCVCVHVCVCPSVRVSLCRCIFMCLSLSVYLFVYIRLRICLVSLVL